MPATLLCGGDLEINTRLIGEGSEHGQCSEGPRTGIANSSQGRKRWKRQVHFQGGGRDRLWQLYRNFPLSRGGHNSSGRRNSLDKGMVCLGVLQAL